MPGRRLPLHVVDQANQHHPRAAGGRRVGFEFGYVRADDPEAEKSARLVVACGPDDDGEPVLTVMFPHED